MLYEEILRGCEKYHRSEDGKRFDKDYNDYMSIDRDESKWNQPNLLDLAEAGKLMGFLNLWKTPVQVRLVDLRDSLECTALLLKHLEGKTLLNVNFRGTVSNDAPVEKLIEVCFNILSKSGRRDEITAASKILHTMYPALFVMWDDKIRKEHASSAGYNGTKAIRDHAAEIYASVFLPKMQERANQAIGQVMNENDIPCRDDAIKWLIGNCKHKNSLAKIIDEYNIVTSR